MQSGSTPLSPVLLEIPILEAQTRSRIDISDRRHTLLGISVDAITGPELIQLTATQIESGSGCLLFGNHNLHSLRLFHTLPEMKAFYEQCDLVHIDGMSLIALGRWMGFPLTRSHRTTYLDWIHAFLNEANAKAWRLYVIGGTKEFAQALPGALRSCLPSLQVTAHHGFITAAQDKDILEDIARFSPDVVMVGMGMPRQEAWIIRNRPQLKSKIIFNCGAAFEYLVGVKRSPPRWAGRMGIEWLFRLINEPTRLARRYLVEPFCLIPLIARATLDGMRRRSVISKTTGLP